MKPQSLALVVTCALAVLLSPCPAPAHDPGLSTMAITVGDEKIDVRVTLTRAELELAFGTRTEPAALHAVEVWADGQPLAVTRSSVDDVDDVELDLNASFPRSRDARRVRIAVPFIGRLARGHRQYATVTDRHGNTVATQLLSAADFDLEVELGR